jgi:hypothetical protein
VVSRTAMLPLSSASGSPLTVFPDASMGPELQ